MIVRAAAVLLSMMCAAAWTQPLRAAEPPVDPGLLEFLGSVDSEDGKWHQYLASTDVEQVAKRTARPPSTVPPASTPPGSSGGAQHPAGTPPPVTVNAP